MIGIHGDGPVRLYADLCDVVDEIIDHFNAEKRILPEPRTQPMQEVAWRPGASDFSP